MPSLLRILALAGVASAACPYLSGDLEKRHDDSESGSTEATEATEEFFQDYYLNDTDTYLTTDTGNPIEDQQSLSAGERGPTLLEDFIFRQKIQRFDHERVSCAYIASSTRSIANVSNLLRDYRSPNVPSTRVVPVGEDNLPDQPLTVDC